MFTIYTINVIVRPDLLHLNQKERIMEFLHGYEITGCIKTGKLQKGPLFFTRQSEEYPRISFINGYPHLDDHVMVSLSYRQLNEKEIGLNLIATLPHRDPLGGVIVLIQTPQLSELNRLVISTSKDLLERDLQEYKKRHHLELALANAFLNHFFTMISE